MTAKRKTSDIDTARRHLNAAARRLKRQQNRVARQIAEGRDTTAARKLLSTFEKRVDHARYFMKLWKVGTANTRTVASTSASSAAY